MNLKKSVNVKFHKNKCGEFIIGSFEKKLCLLDFRYRKMREVVDQRIKSGLGADYSQGCDETIDHAISQLDEYTNGDRTLFDVPLLMVGTALQNRVWEALLKVGYGEVTTYAKLAQSMGENSAIGAVASANAANAIAIMVPCHRVVGTSGELVGYGGGLPIKKRLLEIEQVCSSQLRLL